MVTIEFEQEEETKWVFAHITSNDGILGHARQLEVIPKGVLVSIPPKYQPTLTNWMIKKCGFRLRVRLQVRKDVWYDILIKE